VAGVREIFTPEKPQDVFLADRTVQEILYLIRQNVGTGINSIAIKSNVKKRKDVITDILTKLVEKGEIRVDGNGDGKPHVYFPA